MLWPLSPAEAVWDTALLWVSQLEKQKELQMREEQARLRQEVLEFNATVIDRKRREVRRPWSWKPLLPFAPDASLLVLLFVGCGCVAVEQKEREIEEDKRLVEYMKAEDEKRQ